jgi:hypothetical protein
MYLNPNYSALDTHGQVAMDSGDSMDLSLTTNHADDSQFYMTNTKRLGIGTKSPLSRLHIKGHVSESHSGSLFRVEGSSGSLFEVIDSLEGSLLSVNDISGLPILEVFSDDRVVMGSFAQNTLVVTGSKVGIGITNPTPKLEIVSSVTGLEPSILTLRTSTASNSYLTQIGLNSSGYGYLQIQQATSTYDIPLAIQPNGGKVGIGITNPSYPLVVRGNPATIELQDSGNSDKSWRIINDAGYLTFTETGVAGHLRIYDGTGNVQLLTTTAQLLLPLSNDATTPTLAFGDGDSGFYEESDDTIRIALVGVSRYRINTSGITGIEGTNRFQLVNEEASSTNPTLAPTRQDTNTGIGWAGSSTGSLIAGGVNVLN